MPLSPSCAQTQSLLTPRPRSSQPAMPTGLGTCPPHPSTWEPTPETCWFTRTRHRGLSGARGCRPRCLPLPVREASRGPTAPSTVQGRTLLPRCLRAGSQLRPTAPKLLVEEFEHCPVRLWENPLSSVSLSFLLDNLKGDMRHFIWESTFATVDQSGVLFVRP